MEIPIEGGDWRVGGMCGRQTTEWEVARGKWQVANGWLCGNYY